MNRRPFISVIVPIYNIEKYLDECVESILRQTYTDFELILIDDGSPDNSGEKADEWSKRDARITVIHKENGGVSSARNAGLKVAKGDWFLFVDSDDYVADNYIELLLRTAMEQGADIASCKFYNLWTNMCRVEQRMPCENTIIERDVYLERIYLYGVYTIVWNKIFKRELFDGLLFEEGRINEDSIIMPKLIGRANKVAHLAEPLYYYRRRKSGIMKDDNVAKLLISLLQWLKEDAARYEENGSVYLSKLAKKQCANKILEYYVLLEPKLRKEMKKDLRTISKELVQYKRFSHASRAKLFVASHAPGIYSRWYNGKQLKVEDYISFD